MFPLRLASRLALVSLFLSVVAVSASGQLPDRRIVAPVDESSRTVLRGNVPSLARPDFDQGEAPPSTELTSLRIVLVRSPQQQAALDAFMAQQLDPSSPNFHHWLTPDDFGRLYGPSDSDIDAISAWLQSHGFHIDDIPPGRTNIAFSGSVAQVEEAFHVSMHAFQANGEQFLANTTDPSIPAALAPVVSGVAQLNTIRPRPASVPSAPGQFDPASHRLLPQAAPPSLARPALTTGMPGSYALYLVPSDAATIYDTPNSFNAGFASGATSYTGSTVSIGIVGDALINPATVVNYRSRFLNDTTAPTINNISPVAVAGADTDEAYLDVEIAGGLAPGASITLYTSNTLQTAIQTAVSANAVDILSVSFGECEQNLGTSGNQLLNGLWQQASSQGMAVVVATGDNGSAACDDNTTETAAAKGLQVSGFASTPYNLAVGGTDFASLIGGFTTYVSTTNSTAASTPYLSAKSYIPENVWNNSSISHTTVSNDVPAQGPPPASAYNILAGGGGVSACSTVTAATCTAGYPKPAWQRGAGVPGDGARDIPDVSLFSGNGVDAASWLVCTDDPVSSTPTPTDNCDPANPQFAFIGFGGTSTSTPAFAGMLALVEQKTGARLGLAALELYNLFNSSRAGVIFHDITAGNNAVVCNAGTPNCQKNGAGYTFLTGYDATAGYDLASGMGSVDVTQLVANWGAVNGSAAATVTLTPSATSITSIQGLTVNVTVAGSGSAGTPTGTVTLSDGGNYSATAPLASGAASFQIAAGTLQTGTDSLTATYSGDVNYATTSNSVQITVSPISYSLTATAPAAVTPGNQATSTVTVTSGNGYTGSVALSCTATSTPANAIDVPACTITTGSPVTLTTTSKSGTATITFNTTAPIAAMTPPRFSAWPSAGAVFAALVFFGIPARRRRWQSLLGGLILAVAFLGISACGSTHTTNGTGGSNSNPGTTAGSYTYTVTGTGTPAFNPAPTTTITLTVN
ncbi:hypothetical protein DYQ86_25835 [Acidobacteria bacterium AB60]|nr:hypothetical protein DYQ86_25835 [Acidobacteria bacterium AB60]